jgi:hypothetical protein
MDLRLHFSPTHATSKNRDTLISRITSLGAMYTFSSTCDVSQGNGYATKTHWILYSLQKRRPRVVRIDGKYIKVEHGSWEIWIYKIPRNLPVDVEQHTRFFKIRQRIFT